jgi:DNA-binding beta-propeller fold protein YncE
VALDAKGRLYVADAGDTDRIRRIDRDGRVTTLPGTFDTPSGLAIDRAGDVIVADTGANAIRRISPKGEVTTLAGDGTAGFRDGPAAQARFNGPIGVAVDGKGNVYVADTYNDRIRLIAPDGQVKTLAGGAAPGFADGVGASAAFDTPCGIALDRSGAILVADTGNDAIRKLTPDGRVATLARGALDDRDGVLRAPVGLAATWDGFVYISSFRRGRIVELSPRGELRILSGRDAPDAGNSALRLASPAGLALDRAGALYVADASAYAVRKLSPRRPGAAVVNQQIAAAPPAFVHAASFPWPVAPQTAWHEVVGGMGEVRGDYKGEARDHIHAGLDVRADVGQTVLAVADEKVESPLPDWDLDGLSEGLRIDAMTYIHMKVGRTPAGAPLDPARFQLVRDTTGHLAAVRVKRGTRFHVGDPLGTVNRMAHVHLELGPPGGQINPMVLRFPGLADHFAPRISAIQLFDTAGRRLTDTQRGRLVVPAKGGALSIVVDAWDQVDGDEARRRVGLYTAGFQILRPDGSPVHGFEQPRIGIQFDRMPLDREAVKIAYAPASGDAVHSAQPTRFLYVVTNRVRGGEAQVEGWDPAALEPGDYVVRILAADYAGNQALAGRDLPIAVR